uniref:Putative RecF/RecN/SMC domain contining protein n=1 Tax=viral metagenome TaxID=1070528 RepID=A0A6M3JEL5_9ZZZZ
MNTIPFKKLMLGNFQGGTITINADGQNLNIYGQNASGKTRLMSAFLWLLTGKDSLGRGDFEIKNIDGSGNQEHGLDHTVEAVFCIGGNDLALKKVYHEVWTKKRGQAKAEMTGNTTDHFIDGVPAKENEYKACVAEVFGDETRFRLLTNSAAFALMPWQRQRSLLLEVCGDIPDADIITADESLAPLRSALAKYTVSKTPLDDLKKVTMGRRTEINKQIDQIPIRIDEARRGLPDVAGLDKTVLGAEIVALEGELNAVKLKLAGVDTGGKIAPLTKELNTVESEISRLENDHRLKQEGIASGLDRQIRELAAIIEADARKEKSVKAEIEEKRARVAAIDRALATLREKWDGVDGEEFQDTTNAVCAACGQNLPVDKVEAAREKAKANFNASKAERLAEIQTKGKGQKDEKDRLSHEIGQLEDRISVPLNQAGSKEEIERLTTERDTAKETETNYSVISGRGGLLEKKAAIESDIRTAKETTTVDQQPLLAEIASLSISLGEAKEKADRFVRRESGERRIQDLKAEEKKLAGEFEELEKLLYLIETFIKHKVSLLTGRINSKFELVRFKLFNVLVNQGIEETCEITVGGVPYFGGLNSAARTNGGLDVIRTLQQHYGIAPPIFVDNAESVVDLLPVDCQMIRLIVSGVDTVLRIEKSIDKPSSVL